MEAFWKAAAAVLMALILGLSLEKQGKEFSVLLTTALCCMLMLAFFTLLEPVIAFFYELQDMTSLDPGTLKTLLKLVGIGLVGETTALICADAGAASLGKGLQLLASGVVLSLSVPVFRSLLELVQEILGGL